MPTCILHVNIFLLLLFLKNQNQLFEKCFQEHHHQSVKLLGPDQDPNFVGPDLGPNY